MDTGVKIMDNRLIPAICLTVFLTLIIVQVIMRSERPVRSAVFSLFPGPLAMLCLNLLSGITSVSVPVSPLALSVAAVLGIPGVTCLLVLCRIF